MDYLPLSLNAAAGRPLYQQLYDFLVAEITSGRAAAGERLPAKRSLAANLGVSLNTVETALGMLAAEGYVEARPRSGCYVADIAPLLPPVRPLAAAAAPTPAAAPAPAYDFSTSGVDTALFPFKTWSRIARGVLAADPGLLNHGPAEGDAELRGAIAGYLHEFRGVHCSAQQIVVGAGMEYLLGLLAHLLPGPVALEQPGYPKARQIFANSGLATVPVPVDAEGLDVAALARSGAATVYVTPSHQFPTGALMPAARRTALLRWAAAGQRVVIEDDYDSEFRFDGRPVPSLQSLDTAGRVVYVGTFSRSIAPGIRIGYLVLPAPLLARYRSVFAGYSCTVSRLEQQTLARFLTDGHFTRCLNRARGVYRARRNALTAALAGAFGGTLTLCGAHTGLHLVAAPGLPLTEAELVARAAAAGVRVTGLSRYGAPPAFLPGPAVVLGYATLDTAAVGAAARRLAVAWGAGPAA